MHRTPEQQSRPFPLRRLPALLASAALAVLLVGCGGARSEMDVGRELVTARRGPALGPAQSSAGASLAHRFALAYARLAYRRAVPALPGASTAVNRLLAAAAQRVPPSRRRLQPRLAALRVWPLGRGRLQASAWIADRRNPPFSIGFTLSRRGGRWLVTTVSPPG